MLDEEEDVIETRLGEINEAKETDKDILNVDTDEESNFKNYEGFDDEEGDDHLNSHEQSEEEDEGQNLDYGMGKDSTDPQILKLQDRIKFFRHRCVASLGNNMYERAYDFLKESGSEGATADEKREGLVQILGDDYIGFWSILD